MCACVRKVKCLCACVRDMEFLSLSLYTKEFFEFILEEQVCMAIKAYGHKSLQPCPCVTIDYSPYPKPHPSTYPHPSNDYESLEYDILYSETSLVQSYFVSNI